MMGHRRIIDSFQNGLPLEWQVADAPPLGGNADSFSSSCRVVVPSVQMSGNGRLRIRRVLS